MKLITLSRIAGIFMVAVFLRGGISFSQQGELPTIKESIADQKSNSGSQENAPKTSFAQKVKALLYTPKFLCTVSGAFLLVVARYCQKTRKEKNIFWRWYHQWQKERQKQIARRYFEELLRSPDHTMDLGKLKYILESDQESRRSCPTCDMQNAENHEIIQQKINRIEKKHKKDRSFSEDRELQRLQDMLKNKYETNYKEINREIIQLKKERKENRPFSDLSNLIEATSREQQRLRNMLKNYIKTTTVLKNKYKEKHFYSLENRHSYCSSWIRNTTGGEYLCIENGSQRNHSKYKNIQRTDWQYCSEADWVLLFLKAGVTLDKEAFHLLCEYYKDRLKVVRCNAGYANSLPAYILYTVPESEKKEEFITYLLQQNLDPFFLHTLSFGPPDVDFSHLNERWWEARGWEISTVVASYIEHMLDSYPYDLNKTFLELFQEHIGMEISKKSFSENRNKLYYKYGNHCKFYCGHYIDPYWGRFLQTSILYNIVSSAYFDPDAAVSVVQRLLARGSDPNKRTEDPSKYIHKRIPSFFGKLLSGTIDILDKDFHYNEQCKNNISRFLKSRIALTQLFLHYGVHIPSYYEEQGSEYYNHCQKVLEDDNAPAVKKIVAEQYKSTIVQICDLIKKEQEFRQQFLQLDIFDFEVQKSIFDQLITLYPRPDLWMKRILHEANPGFFERRIMLYDSQIAQERQSEDNNVLVAPITIEDIGSVFVDKLKRLLAAKWDEKTDEKIYETMERMQLLVPWLIEKDKQFFISHAPLFRCLNQIAEEGYYERPIYKTLKPMLHCCIELMSTLDRSLPNQQSVKTHENMIFKRCGKNIIHLYARKGFDNKGLKLIVDQMKRSPLQFLSMLLQKEKAPSQFLQEGYTPFDLAGKYEWVYELALKYSWDKGAGERNENVCTAFQIMKDGLQECIKFQKKSDHILSKRFENQIHKAKKLLQSFSGSGIREAV